MTLVTYGRSLDISVDKYFTIIRSLRYEFTYDTACHLYGLFMRIMVIEIDKMDNEN